MQVMNRRYNGSWVKYFHLLLTFGTPSERKAYLGNWGSSNKFYSLTFNHMSARFFYHRYKIICSFIFDPIVNAFILKSLCRFHNGWCYWKNFVFANFLKISDSKIFIWRKAWKYFTYTNCLPKCLIHSMVKVKISFIELFQFCYKIIIET